MKDSGKTIPTATNDSCAIYVRIASGNQSNDRSLKEQRAICEGYAKKNSLQIVSYFEDIYSGASTLNKDLQAMLSTDSEQKISKIIIDRYDRIAKLG